ncbi:hypothetical protein J6590_031300 [Homalodisca vitripennis]|nr:hypothetical protein J6590_031300 [Homalodisca vitripennis]
MYCYLSGLSLLGNGRNVLSTNEYQATRMAEILYSSLEDHFTRVLVSSQRSMVYDNNHSAEPAGLKVNNAGRRLAQLSPPGVCGPRRGD